MWHYFVVIIVIIIIIWAIVASNRTPDTHIHPKPLFDPKTNTLKIRLSSYALKFTGVEEKFDETESSKNSYVASNGHSLGSDSSIDEIFSFTNTKSSGTKTVQLPPGTNILNTTVRVTNFIGKEDVINPVILEDSCASQCLGAGDVPQCIINCEFPN